MPSVVTRPFLSSALLGATFMLAAASSASTTIEWALVEPAGDVVTVAIGGAVVPYKEVTLSAQIPGRVLSIAGLEGDAFTSGEELVRIEDSELQAQRNSAVAQLANAEVEFRNANVQYTREIWAPQSRTPMSGMGIPGLFDDLFTQPMQNVIGDYDTDAARSADLYSSQNRIQQARNSITQAQSQIQAIDAKLRDARSLAPFNGVITDKLVEVGDTVQPGQPLLRYADVEFLQVVVDVPSRIAPQLREGQMYEAELDGSSRRVPVRVAQVFPVADLVRHSVKVKFDLPQGVSRPGSYIRVRLPDTSAADGGVVKVPSSAVRVSGSLPGVYVRDENNQPRLRLIRLGSELDGGYVAVLSGLQAGEYVQRNPNF